MAGHGPSRRQVLLASGPTLVALAGCLGDDREVDPDAPPEEQISQHLDGANGESAIRDHTGESTVRVENGDGEAVDGFAFDPAAIRINPGTTVHWEWVDTSPHSVTHDRGDAFDSGIESGEGTTFEHTFEETGLFLYLCRPHERDQRGAVLVD